MDFRILGPIEAIEGNRPLALGGAKQRALLGMLLLHANEVVSSDRLIDELWAGDRREEAVRALQVAVSRLRKALRPDRVAGAESGLVVTRAPGYELRTDPERLDVKRFEALASEAKRALLAKDARSARAKLDEALRLWRGPPLADLAYESFCQAEIARLEELRLAALEDRIAADLELGRADVVAELEALTDQHPLRERLRGQLMLALYRSGRQAEALETYRQTRRVLVEEQGARSLVHDRLGRAPTVYPGSAVPRLREATYRAGPMTASIVVCAPLSALGTANRTRGHVEASLGGGWRLPESPPCRPALPETVLPHRAAPAPRLSG